MTLEIPNNPLHGPDQNAALPDNSSLPPRSNVSPVAFAFIALAVVFLLYQVFGGTVTFFIFGSKPRPNTVQWFRFTTMAGQLLLILLPTLVLTRFQGNNLRDTLRLRPTGTREIFLSIVGVLSLQQILQVYLNIQDQVPIPSSVRPLADYLRKAIEETYRQLVSAHSVPELVFVLLVVALVPAICEELLFRGLVQKNFERGVRGWWGIILPGLIFGAYHFNPFSLVPLAVLGIYFGFLVFRSNSIVPSVAAHFANNLFAVLAVFFSGDENILLHDETGFMSVPTISLALGGFGVVFAISTYGFVKLTRQPPAPQIP